MTDSHQESSQLGPVQSQERIILLDVVRAFAILGMFYSNWGGTYHPDLRDLDHGVVQSICSFVRGWYISGKFYPLFALLMGVGMGVQIERAVRTKGNIVPIYLRRLFSLYFLGWVGWWFLPIRQLEYLAVAGLVTFFIGYVLRRHRLLLFAVVCWMFLADAIPQAVDLHDPERRALMAKRREESDPDPESRIRSIERFEEYEREAVSVSSPFFDREIIQQRAERTVSNPIPGDFRSLGNLVTSQEELILYMLIGFLVWQVGLFKRVWERRRFFFYLLIISTVVGLAEMVWSESVTSLAEQGVPDARIAILTAVKPFLWILSTVGVDLAYISALALLISFNRPARWLKKLAPAGRMAFTTYVLQWALPPILFPILFGWWMPGVTPAEIALKVTVVFALLVLFSTWWLRRFRFGPFEWLWRSLTYWERQPMRVQPPSPAT